MHSTQKGGHRHPKKNGLFNPEIRCWPAFGTGKSSMHMLQCHGTMFPSSFLSLTRLSLPSASSAKPLLEEELGFFFCKLWGGGAILVAVASRRRAGNVRGQAGRERNDKRILWPKKLESMKWWVIQRM